MTKKLKKIKIKNASGGLKNAQIHGKILPLRSSYYTILDFPLGGDAPKDFINVYEYGIGKRANSDTWNNYLAKVGHKWYPQESIIEHLLNRIGEVIGLRMAESQLRLAHGQIRFLSKYFLEKGQSLIHGAQIYSTYLNEANNDFVHEIEAQNMTRELLTFQLTNKAIKSVFPNQYDEIMQAFVNLLLFDAIVGNNDRHFYNWAVITSIDKKHQPVFSPIYDSARGLFWNKSEATIEERFFEGKGKKERINDAALNKYIRSSKPKTGWNEWKGKKENHLDLINLIYKHYPEHKKTCDELLKNVHLSNIQTLIKQEFKLFFTPKRYLLIEACIERRFKLLQSLCEIS